MDKADEIKDNVWKWTKIRQNERKEILSKMKMTLKELKKFPSVSFYLIPKEYSRIGNILPTHFREFRVEKLKAEQIPTRFRKEGIKHFIKLTISNW